ncbi:MAG TPA: DUF1223 domain-containing protein [Caulobacteraceae bacterium]
MNTHPIPSLVAALAILASGSALAADAAHPTVVELFQSQGCSSCPPANANLMAIAARPDILALSFGVTYWDQLGWKDTFAQDAFTARQWDYARGLHHPNVFTPQVVVNGRRDGVGANLAELGALIAAGDRGGGGPSLTLAKGKVALGPGRAPAGGADIWLVRYDPRIVQVPVKRGENAGRTLPHRNVVRELVRIGRWNGQAIVLTAPTAKDPALAAAILVQQSGGGPILAAARA